MLKTGSALYQTLCTVHLANGTKVRESQGECEILPFIRFVGHREIRHAVCDTWRIAISGTDAFPINKSGVSQPFNGRLDSRISTLASFIREPFPSVADIAYISREIFGNEHALSGLASACASDYNQYCVLKNEIPDPTYEKEFFAGFIVRAYLVLLGHSLVKAAFINKMIVAAKDDAAALKLTLNILPTQFHYRNLRKNKAAWNNIRDVIMDGAMNECEVCDSDEDLEVHEEWQPLLTPVWFKVSDAFSDEVAEFLEMLFKNGTFVNREGMSGLERKFSYWLAEAEVISGEDRNRAMFAEKPFILWQNLNDLQCLCKKCHSFKHINGTTDRLIKQHGQQAGLKIVQSVLTRAQHINGLTETVFEEYIEIHTALIQTAEVDSHTGVVMYDASDKLVQSIITNKSTAYSEKIERRKLVDDGYGSF